METCERQKSSPPVASKSRMAVRVLGFVVGLSTVPAFADSEASRYPEYDIVAFCRSEISTGLTKRLHDCEDREYAVAIILRAQWPALSRAEPDFIEACVDWNATFDPEPSYVSLLQCITRVRNAAD